MAYKDGETIDPTGSYSLGEYTFDVQNVVSEGERVIQAHCTGPEGSAAHGITVPTSNRFVGWYVDANETEASVYALIGIPTQAPDRHSSLVEPDVPVATSVILETQYTSRVGSKTYHIVRNLYITADAVTLLYKNANQVVALCASKNSQTINCQKIIKNLDTGEIISSDYLIHTTTKIIYDGKTAYWNSASPAGDPQLSTGPIYNQTAGTVADAAWTMIYGNPSGEVEYNTEERLIARFAIDVEEAGGGAGGGGGWSDPVDDGEPDTTLHVNVTGALSGRHNDPLNNTSYSYIPADKATVKPPGCGGDGGHGGGGGAGASTVIVNKFSTSRASSKEIKVIARRHGYGSGGGKGGKGGDGCVLIYY